MKQSNLEYNFRAQQSRFPTMPCRSSQRVTDNEERIQKAIDRLRKGQYSSVRAAAKAHDISHVTLN